MNISLTPELEEFIAGQLKTGHYKSASEVVREALRSHVRESMEEKLDFRIASARQQIAEGATIEADANYFDRKRKMIRKKYINNLSTA